MRIELQTGILNIRSEYHETLLRLAGFGARANQKRGFVFVSKVLGKHWPARPAEMRAAQRQLAEQTRTRLDTRQPTLVIGFAETATGLGHGVYEQLGLDNALYLHSTRYFLRGQQPWLNFEEEHSHATRQLLYRPRDPALRELMEQAGNVVLVDDEFSTGKTLLNLAAQLRPRLPRVKKIVAAALLDWRPHDLPGIECVSLYRGCFDFIGKDMAVVAAPAQSREAWWLDLPSRFGRLGTRQLAPDWRAHLDPREFSGQNLLVLGTGEFMHAALLLAEYLEAHGAVAHVQSTTRSPLLVDAAIGHKLEFPDNYAEGIPNYLYNLRPYDAILICYETPPQAHELAHRLGAHARRVVTLHLEG
jgi:hypothetical protein